MFNTVENAAVLLPPLLTRKLISVTSKIVVVCVNGVCVNGVWLNGFWVKAVCVKGVCVNGVCVKGVWVNGVCVNGDCWKEIGVRPENGLVIIGVCETSGAWVSVFDAGAVPAGATSPMFLRHPRLPCRCRPPVQR